MRRFVCGIVALVLVACSNDSPVTPVVPVTGLTSFTVEATDTVAGTITLDWQDSTPGNHYVIQYNVEGVGTPIYGALNTTSNSITIPAKMLTGFQPATTRGVSSVDWNFLLLATDGTGAIVSYLSIGLVTYHP